MAKVRRDKKQAHEKVGKSRFTMFFQWFVAQEGRKVGSLKRRVLSHVARWEMKNCTPLWREAHFEVKSVNRRKGSDHFWTFRCFFLRGRCKGLCTLSKVRKTWGFCSSFDYNYNYDTLHYTTLHYTTLHYATPHYTTLHYITLHYTTLH